MCFGLGRYEAPSRPRPRAISGQPSAPLRPLLINRRHLFGEVEAAVQLFEKTGVPEELGDHWLDCIDLVVRAQRKDLLVGLTVDLSAERSGTVNERTYTLNVTCTDRAGNTSQPGATVVLVPHDQGKK
jgi:hypothetical protein